MEFIKGPLILFACIGFGLLCGYIVYTTLKQIGKLLPKSILMILENLWSALITIGIIIIVLLCLWSCIPIEDTSNTNEFDDRRGPFYRGQQY